MSPQPFGTWGELGLGQASSLGSRCLAETLAGKPPNSISSLYYSAVLSNSWSGQKQSKIKLGTVVPISSHLYLKKRMMLMCLEFHSGRGDLEWPARQLTGHFMHFLQVNQAESIKMNFGFAMFCFVTYQF
jgi:hypothetical protein